MRHITREDALFMARLMLVQQVVYIRVMKHRLSQPHRNVHGGCPPYPPPSSAPDDQRQLVLAKRRAHLLNVMLASGRHQLHHAFQRCWVAQPDGKPNLLAIRKEGYRRQGDWVESHKSFDYDRLNAVQGGPYSTYKGWSHVWWFELQLSLAKQVPAGFPQLPLYFAELWEGLIGLKDPAAREAALRLAGRHRDERGWPIYHPWRP